jgi:DNA-binding FadR family transcriptional regulator
MHQQVVDELGRRIVNGLPEPDGSLPVEDTLAAELGVSRGALREAVKALAAKGMLLTRPRTGTRVLPREQWNHLDRDVLSWQQARDPRELLRATGELRRAVEPEAARLAARRARPDHIRTMFDALGEMESAAVRPGLGAYVEADIAFHRALLDASGNLLFGSLGRALDVALEHGFAAASRTPGAIEALLPPHRALAEAVEGGRSDEASAAIMTIIDAAEGEIARSLATPG